MSDFLDIMILPFLACLILTGMHAYLGLHVIERGILFVDLALAQVAAFGATIGFLFGWGLHSLQGYFVSLACTLLAAGLLALFRHERQRIPQEAWIGVVYALAAAGSILVLSRAPEGGEELKSLLVGHLLFVNLSELKTVLILYSLVGLLHYFARKPLLQISADPKAAFAAGRNVRAWDLFFYATFGVVVTSSTELAGVLLVFSYLVVPAICGVLLAHSPMRRLLVGWAVGAVTSVIGILFSYFFDFPTGAAIVCTFGLTLVICIGLGAIFVRTPSWP